MSLGIVNISVPLKTDIGGVVRVGNTRVTLDTIITTFKEGATAEEIVSQYPSLSLAIEEEKLCLLCYESRATDLGFTKQTWTNRRISMLEKRTRKQSIG
jgi:uncharacterized protein (DUF433 family)